MMRSKDYINLLPGDEGAAPRVMSTGVLILSVAALLWLAAYGWQVKIAWGLKKQLRSHRTTKQGLLDKLQSMQKELGIPVSTGANPEQSTLIRNLLGERVLWSEVFKQFSQIVPSGMWFDALEGSVAERAEIRIKGGAYNYLSVAEFMLAVEDSAYFDKPQLLYARRAMVQGQEVIGFEIVCGIVKGQGMR